MKSSLLALLGVFATAVCEKGTNSSVHDFFLIEESWTGATETPVKLGLRGRQLLNEDGSVCKQHGIVSPAAQSYSFKLDPRKPFYMIHIPKCAGGSATVSMGAILKKHGGSFDGAEICFASAKIRCATNTQFGVILRSPRTHVVSQFFYLKCCGGWCPLNHDEALDEPKGARCCKNFPDVDDEKSLNLWLDWYGESDWEPRSYPLTSAAMNSKHVGN